MFTPVSWPRGEGIEYSRRYKVPTIYKEGYIGEFYWAMCTVQCAAFPHKLSTSLTELTTACSEHKNTVC